LSLRIIIVVIIITILYAVIIIAKSQACKELNSQMMGWKVGINMSSIIPLCQSITSNTLHTNTTLELIVFVVYFLLHVSVIHIDHHQVENWKQVWNFGVTF